MLPSYYMFLAQLPGLFLLALWLLIQKTKEFDIKSAAISTLAEITSVRYLYLLLASGFILSQSTFTLLLVFVLFPLDLYFYLLILLGAICALLALPLKSWSTAHTILMFISFTLTGVVVSLIGFRARFITVQFSYLSYLCASGVGLGILCFRSGKIRMWRAEFIALFSVALWNFLLLSLVLS